MKKYLGVKVVHAEPMSEDTFISTVKNQDIPHNKEDRPGYKVVYEDGYTSWSPKDVFEKAYRSTTGLSFGLALEAAKSGNGMRLPNWSSDVVVKAQYPDKFSKMTAPYLYVESRFGKVPWKETMIELFSEEWEVVDQYYNCPPPSSVQCCDCEPNGCAPDQQGSVTGAYSHGRTIEK
jgi:hypothetical protein